MRRQRGRTQSGGGGPRKKGRRDVRMKPTLTAPEVAETTGQGTKFCPNFARREVPKSKATYRSVGERLPHLHPLPPPSDRSSSAAPGGSPRTAPLPSLHAPGPPPGDAPARPGLHPELPGRISGPGLRLPPAPTPARARTPARPQASGPDPRPALRVVLVEVGEEQLAGAGLAALTRQVHGGRAAGGPD